jgi:hypothetical protein
MDQEDLLQIAHLAVGEAGSTTPKDARPTAAEGSGASSGGDLLGRLRALQDQVARLAAEAREDDGSGVVPGAGTRIVIVPTAPGRPELPPRATGGPRPAPAAPERHRRSEAERRGADHERRARHDRRRRDVGPAAGAADRRTRVEDRRSGRGDRRLGHDRRAERPGRPRRERRAAMLLLATSAELLVLAAGVLALALGT